MEALKAVAVSKRYGESKVLENFDLSLEKGAFEALMGPSGCGKSTFLNLAAGLLGIDSGAVFIGGECITSMKDSAAAKFRRRRVGVVFQDFNLLEDRTAKENIVLPLRLDGVRLEGETASRFDGLVQALGLGGKLSCRPGELSGGERQRVAFARALVAAPDVVLADEPTGNLDVDSARGICEILKSLGETSSSAILLVTHDPVVAASAKKVNFLKDGAIAASFETAGDASLVSRRYIEVYG